MEVSTGIYMAIRVGHFRSIILPFEILPSIMCEYAREHLYGIYRLNMTLIYSRHTFNAALGWTANTQVAFKFEAIFSGSTPSLAITVINISSSPFEGMGRNQCLSCSAYFHAEHPMKYSFPYFEHPFEGNQSMIKTGEPGHTEAIFRITGFPEHGTLHLSFCTST